MQQKWWQGSSFDQTEVQLPTTYSLIRSRFLETAGRFGALSLSTIIGKWSDHAGQTEINKVKAAPPWSVETVFRERQTRQSFQDPTFIKRSHPEYLPHVPEAIPERTHSLFALSSWSI